MAPSRLWAIFGRRRSQRLPARQAAATGLGVRSLNPHSLRHRGRRGLFRPGEPRDAQLCSVQLPRSIACLSTLLEECFAASFGDDEGHIAVLHHLPRVRPCDVGDHAHGRLPVVLRVRELQNCPAPQAGRLLRFLFLRHDQMPARPASRRLLR